MHINFSQIGKNINEIELAHIQQCDECKNQYQLLSQLYQDAHIQPTINPPEEVWLKICATRNNNRSNENKQQTKKSQWQWLIGLAASTLFFTVTWLAWNNYQLQFQLEQVLLVNQGLEIQLIQNQVPSYRQAQLLLEVRKIELNLSNSKSKKEKLALLKQRYSLMSEMVKENQGNKYEYSI